MNFEGAYTKWDLIFLYHQRHFPWEVQLGSGSLGHRRMSVNSFVNIALSSEHELKSHDPTLRPDFVLVWVQKEIARGTMVGYSTNSTNQLQESHTPRVLWTSICASQSTPSAQNHRHKCYLPMAHQSFSDWVQRPHIWRQRTLEDAQARWGPPNRLDDVLMNWFAEIQVDEPIVAQFFGPTISNTGILNWQYIGDSHVDIVEDQSKLGISPSLYLMLWLSWIGHHLV